MANHKINISGLRFGALLAVEPTEGRIRNQVAWRAECDCGNEFIVPGAEFRVGRYASCGCLANGKPRGIGQHPLYAIHHGIVDRCTNPESKDYPRYGARGIAIDETWLDLREFALAIGPRPSTNHSVDRIDNNKGYVPGNVRWATPHQQACNTRRNYFPGRSSIDVCKENGVKPGTFRSRVSKGWSIEEALDARDFRSSQNR